MTLTKMILPIGALALTLSAGGLSAEAGQRGDGRDRGGRNGQAQARSGDSGRRDGGQDQRGGNPRASRDDGRDQRGGNGPGARDDRRDQRDGARPSRNYGQDRAVVRGSRDDPYARRDIIRVRPPVRYDGYRGGPRVIVRGPAYRHYYGSGGHLSVYFGLGSGYRYGSPYYGRVYGYSSPYYDGGRRYFGDVRLQVRPRNAAVYVDGYYAGIVDDFDGVFQRLTLDVGPHQIEVEAPGFEPQVFDVYVDPSRTVDLRGDLFPDRP
jgi:PEGA domain